MKSDGAGMMYLASTGSDLDALDAHANIGLMTSPLAGGYRAVAGGRPWASDCDALTKNPAGHDFDRYLTHLERLTDHAAQCLFVVVPDMPGDGLSTLSSFMAHEWAFGELPFPLAYCMQDGSECLPLPECAVAFLGGTDPWRMKWGASMLRRAREEGMRTHVGRVNSAFRTASLSLTECDSIDGTHVAFKGVEKGVRDIGGWLTAAEGPLFSPAQVPSPLTPFELHGEAAETLLYGGTLPPVARVSPVLPAARQQSTPLLPWPQAS